MKNVKKRILPPIIPFTALNEKRNLRSYFAKTKEVFISNKRFSFSADDIEEIFAQETKRSVYF